MSFISGFTELFIGKKQEAQPVVPPVINLDEKRQDAANLEAMMAQGRDFSHPADAQRLEQLRTEIASAEAQQQVPQQAPQVETAPIGPTLVTPDTQEAPTPIQQPIEEPKVA